MPGYVIKVSGDIVSTEGRHYAQNWVAGGIGSFGEGYEGTIGSSHYDPATHSVASDLILDMNRRAVPYACYVADRGVAVCGEEGKADLICCPGFYPAIAYFHEYISLIERDLEVEVPDEVCDTFYRGLFVDTFSVLELFLSDYILCGVFSDEACYNRAMGMAKLNLGKNATPLKIENKIRNYLTNSVVFHRFARVSKLYQGILGCTLPDTTKIVKYLYKRQNFVHRYNLSNKDRMTVCCATRQDVRDLINECGNFVEKMPKSLTV